MRLYNENYPAPNPRKVRIFLAEKGLKIDIEHVSMASRAHKSPDFLSKNALGQLPVLETDDGQNIS
ncbi:MAG: glutathione S-transferase, partial [Cytophagaceae bacterium]